MLKVNDFKYQVQKSVQQNYFLNLRLDCKSLIPIDNFEIHN